MLSVRAPTETVLGFYKVMTVFTLLYKSEHGTLNKQQDSQTEAAGMRFIRAVSGYGETDHIRKQTDKN
jgi:hypothetical protein